MLFMPWQCALFMFWWCAVGIYTGDKVKLGGRYISSAQIKMRGLLQCRDHLSSHASQSLSPTSLGLCGWCFLRSPLPFLFQSRSWPLNPLLCSKTAFFCCLCPSVYISTSNYRNQEVKKICIYTNVSKWFVKTSCLLYLQQPSSLDRCAPLRTGQAQQVLCTDT